MSLRLMRRMSSLIWRCSSVGLVFTSSWGPGVVAAFAAVASFAGDMSALLCLQVVDGVICQCDQDRPESKLLPNHGVEDGVIY